MHIVGPEKWPKKKKKKSHCKTCKMGMHTVGHKIWREAQKNVENEKFTLQDFDNGEKHCKTLKIKNAHYKTWIMARNLKNVENGTQKLSDLQYDQKH